MPPADTPNILRALVADAFMVAAEACGRFDVGLPELRVMAARNARTSGERYWTAAAAALILLDGLTSTTFTRPRNAGADR